MKIIGAIVLGIIAIICFVVGLFQFFEKGPLLNNTYIYASESERKALNKKPYYKQSGIAFWLVGIIFLINAIEFIAMTGWLFYLVIAIVIITVIYAFASMYLIEKNKK